jgi:hypothetical protein
MAPNSMTFTTINVATPNTVWRLYRLRSIQSSGVLWPNLASVSVFLASVR